MINTRLKTEIDSHIKNIIHDWQQNKVVNIFRSSDLLILNFDIALNMIYYQEDINVHKILKSKLPVCMMYRFTTVLHLISKKLFAYRYFIYNCWNEYVLSKLSYKVMTLEYDTRIT